MPIDYSRYPKNWKTEIRPRIMARSGGICEAEGCGFAHGQIVFAAKRNGKTIGWYKTIEETAGIQISREAKRNPKTGIVEIVPNPKPVKVVLTIAHLDHDETNHDVGDERLAALCQLCHLRYDAKEKYRRVLSKIPDNLKKNESMTPEQKQIIAILQENGGEVTKAQVVEAIGGNYYCNGGKRVGDRLSRMVNALMLIRVKPGVFTLGKGKKSKPTTIAEGQTTLFE